MSNDMKNYVTLGRSGLRVSPFCLGAMTFGAESGWGMTEETARAVFDRYIEVGGNFVDTADIYNMGTSEKMVGQFIADRKLRDSVVLATKFTFNFQAGNPNAGGNGRKNIIRAIDASLKRLQTDYIDLYWLHLWDMLTPVEEVVNTFNDLVRAGKILHYGISDAPAWYITRAYTIAEKEGKERPIAIQPEYSLVERTIEREHIPAAQEMGMGICSWSPLAGGFLAGKYTREGDSGTGVGRLQTAKAPSNSPFNKFTEANWRILEVLLDVAKQMGKPAAQVALNWVATQPGVTSVILGATKVAHLDDNLASMSFEIPDEMRKRLNDASAMGAVHPYLFFSPALLDAALGGGTSVRPWLPQNLFK